MLVARSRPWTPRHSVHFEAVAETSARVEPRTGPRRADGTVAACCGSLTCVRSGSMRTLDDCLHCEHFISVSPGGAASSAILHCLCTADDALADDTIGQCTWRMVEPEMTVASARLLAQVQDVTLLVVAQDGVVIGVVYRDQLEDAVGVVAWHMVEPWSLSPSSTVGDAVEAVRELHIPGLLVIGPASDLVSVISTTDLRRLGVPAQLLR